MSKLVLFPAIPWAGVQLRHSSPARGARKKLAEKLGFRRSGWISCFEVDCKLERKSPKSLTRRFSFLQFSSASFICFSFLQPLSPLEFQKHLAYFDWSGGNRSGPGVIQISKWHPWWWKMRCFCLFSEGWFFRLGSTRKLPKEKKTRPRCFKDTKDMYLLNSFDVKEMEQNIQNKEKHWKTRFFSFEWKPPGLAPKATARRFMDQCFLVPSPHKMFPLPGLSLGLVSQSLQYFCNAN